MPAVGVLYFGLFNPFEYSPLPFTSTNKILKADYYEEGLCT
jgi:hypothetical protein